MVDKIHNSRTHSSFNQGFKSIGDAFDAVSSFSLVAGIMAGPSMMITGVANGAFLENPTRKIYEECIRRFNSSVLYKDVYLNCNLQRGLHLKLLDPNGNYTLEAINKNATDILFAGTVICIGGLIASAVAYQLSQACYEWAKKQVNKPALVN